MLCHYKFPQRFLCNVRNIQRPRAIAVAIVPTKKWDDRELDILESLLMAKAAQCPPYADTLKTNYGFLYTYDDKYWGTGHVGSRDNVLGMLHDRIRQHVLCSPKVAIISD